MINLAWQNNTISNNLIRHKDSDYPVASQMYGCTHRISSLWCQGMNIFCLNTGLDINRRLCKRKLCWIFKGALSFIHGLDLSVTVCLCTVLRDLAWCNDTNVLDQDLRSDCLYLYFVGTHLFSC